MTQGPSHPNDEPDAVTKGPSKPVPLGNAARGSGDGMTHANGGEGFPPQQAWDAPKTPASVTGQHTPARPVHETPTGSISTSGGRLDESLGPSGQPEPGQVLFGRYLV